MMPVSQSKEHYLSAFRRHQQNGARTSPPWLKSLRESAIEDFYRFGFPSPKDEDWKYTSVEPIASLLFERKNGRSRSVSADSLFSLAFADPAFNRLVFIDGRLAPELSCLRGVEDGVIVASLAQALAEDASLLQTHLGRYARFRGRGFVALNTAFVDDGALVFVPKGRSLSEPIYLIFASGGGDRPIVAHPRNLLVFEAQSHARIVECYVGVEAGAYWNNSVTEIVADEGAAIEHYRLQRETAGGFHVGALSATLGRNCNLTAHSVTLGGALVRNDVHATLDGEGGECVLNGLYLVDGHQHVDNHTQIDHVKPHATSFELYKGILSGNGRAVFNGKILVQKAAQKTDARQTNKNLLLSENASVNTKPQLEIHADDVKCSHGSTIGQLDPDALFYLRSRGLDPKQAQSLLSYAFASDVIGRMKILPMRAKLDDYLVNKFGANTA